MKTDFEIELKFNIYGVMMLSQMIAYARRYGDNQVSDYASELREQIMQLTGMPNVIPDMPNPLKDVSPETAARVAVEATQVLEQLADKPEAKPEVKAPAVKEPMKKTVK
jgi:C4-dicarboxylate-specific signal transduction histidine kinase